MKKTIATLLIILNAAAFLNAQKAADTKTPDPETNCYLKWAQRFEDRGADDVADGVYSDVIITFRSGSEAQCFNGKCEVKDARITSMYIGREDGSYELVKKKLRYDFPVTITNGMSKTVLTLDDELINVLFIKKIKAKKAGFVKAVEPTDD